MNALSDPSTLAHLLLAADNINLHLGIFEARQTELNFVCETTADFRHCHTFLKPH